MDAPDFPCAVGFPFAFKEGELRRYYEGWDVLKCNEDVGELHRTDENGNRIKLRFAAMLARKKRPERCKVHIGVSRRSAFFCRALRSNSTVVTILCIQNDFVLLLFPLHHCETKGIVSCVLALFKVASACTGLLWRYPAVRPKVTQPDKYSGFLKIIRTCGEATYPAAGKPVLRWVDPLSMTLTMIMLFYNPGNILSRPQTNDRVGRQVLDKLLKTIRTH